MEKDVLPSSSFLAFNGLGGVIKMITLNHNELIQINGGVSFGTAIFGLIAGALAGGPVGLGMAASALVGAQGVDRLIDLYKE